MGVARRRQRKKVITFRGDDYKKVVRFFKKKYGDTHQLPPRVTTTLVTPLLKNYQKLEILANIML